MTNKEPKLNTTPGGCWRPPQLEEEDAPDAGAPETKQPEPSTTKPTDPSPVNTGAGTTAPTDPSPANTSAGTTAPTDPSPANTGAGTTAPTDPSPANTGAGTTKPTEPAPDKSSAGKTESKGGEKAPPGKNVGKPGAGLNRIGLAQVDYKGAESTLCNGCGHDAISAHIIKACFELGIEQHKVAKLSGIGCSSKTPAYFLGRAHGFNSVHGRMPSIATGVALANRQLSILGVSGDGDTASIGIGQFLHGIRRNVPMLYIIENNGVYGLTKGQFSATADVGSTLKSGVANELPPLDLCAMAVEAGCSFVARSFSGDPRQLVPLIKAGLSHGGTAVIDVISPCVTFNDHEGSTKSHKAARDGDTPLHGLGFVPHFEQITVDYEPGTVRSVTLHDGSTIVLKKLDDRDYDPHDRLNALVTLAKARAQKQFITGLLFIDETAPAFTETLGLPDEPLAKLPESALRPGAEALAAIMDSLL